MIYGYNQQLQSLFLFLLMKPILHFTFYPALCCYLLLVSLPALSMSQSPDEEPFSLEDARTGKYGEQFKDRSPEEDARTAIDKGDLRLLGFATRVTSVPGVPKADKKTAKEVCGVRLIRGFGDVIRSEAELVAMQKASAYAKRYNAVMLVECLQEK